MSTRRSFAVLAALPFFALTACRVNPPTNENDRRSVQGLACGSRNGTPTTGTALGVRARTMGSYEVAQSFRLSADAEVDGVNLYLSATLVNGAPLTGVLVLTLEQDDGGTPSGTQVIRQSRSVQADTILSGAAQVVPFHFSSAASLKKDTPYWLRLAANYAYSPTTSFVSWHGSNTNPDASGRGLYNSDAGWQVPGNIGGSSVDFIYQLLCLN